MLFFSPLMVRTKIEPGSGPIRHRRNVQDSAAHDPEWLRRRGTARRSSTGIAPSAGDRHRARRMASFDRADQEKRSSEGETIVSVCLFRMEVRRCRGIDRLLHLSRAAQVNQPVASSAVLDMIVAIIAMIVSITGQHP